MTFGSVRPTPRAVFFFGLSVPLALAIVTGFRDVWFFALYLPFGALGSMLADMLMILPESRLLTHLNGPSRLHVGRTDAITLQIEAPGYEREIPVMALLELEGDAEPAVPVVGLMLDGRLELTLDITPGRRGRVTVKAFWLRWRGPWGLMETRHRESVDIAIDVVPDIRGVHEAALQFFSRDALYGIKSQRARGEGTEFETLREFTQGMDNRFIDWKRSARHRKLLAKEFRQERNHEVVLGFDTGHLMMENIDGMPKLDHAIRAGLLLGWTSLYSGDLLGGCGFDVHFRSWLKPGRGMPWFNQFQRFAAGLDYHTEETNFTLALAELYSRLQRRAMVVLFTEFVDQVSAELLLESLQRMVRKHVVVFVTLRDPLLENLRGAAPERFADAAQAVLADDFLHDRAVVLERIARLGVHCLDVPAHGMSAALLNRYLMIKQRGLL